VDALRHGDADVSAEVLALGGSNAGRASRGGALAWPPFMAVYLVCTGLGAGTWKYAGMSTAAFCVLYTLAKTVLIWGAWLGWGRGPLLDPRARRFAGAAVVTGVVNGLAWIFYLVAFQRGPAAIVQTVTAMSSVVAAVLAALFLRERFVPTQGIGIVMVMAASLLLAYFGAEAAGGGTPSRGWLPASFAAAVLWGAGSVLAKYAYGLPGAGDVRMNLGQWLGFVLTVLPYGIWLAPPEAWFPAGARLALIVVLLHVVGEAAVFAAIHRGPSTVVNAIAGLYPIPTLVFTGLMIGDWPRWPSWLAIAVALLGIGLSVTAPRPLPADLDAIARRR
jgi:drug/metabolite transporter (DMT)-like permease